MKRYLQILLVLGALFLLTMVCPSCQGEKEKYVIGVSQCSEDVWRSKLRDELDMSTFFNENVELRYAAADDNAKEQEKQINEMVDDGVDLLIVSPQQTELLSAAINRAYDKGIPVILFDRKTDSDKFTAFMGADNYAIGKMLAEYVVGKLDGTGCIVEIKGEKGSSPADERSRGFHDGLEGHPGIKVVASGNGTWKEASGEKVMKDILKTYDGPIDCVFGGNDRMAVGARRALESAGRGENTIYVGIDALPTKGAGISQIRDGILTASAIYPTHGDELMQLALDILEGHPYNRETMMASSVVTASNAQVLLLQHEEIIRQGNYLKKMHAHTLQKLGVIRNQRLVLWLFTFVIVIGAFLVYFIIRANRAKVRLNKELESANAKLTEQRNTLERQRDELQEQRDKLCEQRDEMETQRDELAVQRDQLQRLHIDIDVDSSGSTDSAFYKSFMEIVSRNIDNSDFGVEDLSDALGISRAQIFRKCKAMTGHSPVEIIRAERMKRAGKMLSTGEHNISEVTYSCGFTSPSYFTKCFKEHYGISPSDFIRSQQENKHNPSGN